VEGMVARTGASQELLLAAARQMPYLTSVRQTLEDIHTCNSKKTDQMILSDGNTLFLKAFLQHLCLEHYFTRGVVSNKGSWDENGNLRVVHQSEAYGGHDCPRCSANLCKSQALQQTLSENKANKTIAAKSPRIVYIGDGANDACPVLNVLEQGDVMLARVGRRRTFANERKGPETDEEAEQTSDDEEGSLFGIAATLQRAQEEEGLVPKCVGWRTGDELRLLVQQLLADDAK